MFCWSRGSLLSGVFMNTKCKRTAFIWNINICNIISVFIVTIYHLMHPSWIKYTFLSLKQRIILTPNFWMVVYIPNKNATNYYLIIMELQLLLFYNVKVRLSQRCIILKPPAWPHGPCTDTESTLSGPIWLVWPWEKWICPLEVTVSSGLPAKPAPREFAYFSSCGI